MSIVFCHIPMISRLVPPIDLSAAGVCVKFERDIAKRTLLAALRVHLNAQMLARCYVNQASFPPVDDAARDCLTAE